MTKINLLAEPEKNGIIIDRVFDASREMVWNAWTKSTKIAKWFNTIPYLDINVIELDVRPSGHFRFTIPNQDSLEILGEYTGTYQTVKPQHELSFDVIDYSITKNPNGISASFKIQFETVGNKHY